MRRVGAGCVPEISHAIPSCVLQLLKSERWNFAVFEVVVCVAVGELHAELMWARPVNSTVRAAMLPRAAGHTLLCAPPGAPASCCAYSAVSAAL